MIDRAVNWAKPDFEFRQSTSSILRVSLSRVSRLKFTASNQFEISVVLGCHSWKAIAAVGGVCRKEPVLTTVVKIGWWPR